MNQETALTAQIMRLSTCITREMDALGAQHFDGGLSHTNAHILGYLAKNSHRDVFQRDIEEEFAIRRSSVSKIVQLMERKGLVRRESVSHDARLKRLVLTEKARAIQSAATAEIRDFDRRITEGLSEEEIKTLNVLLGRIQQNLQMYE